MNISAVWRRRGWRLSPWGDEDPDDKAANYGKEFSKTTPVGSYPPNGYGLYDMAGNVWEWCLDEYQEDFYRKSSKENPLAGGTALSELLTNYNYPKVKTPRVLRGGSWLFYPYLVRVACRDGYGPDYWNDNNGFRCTSPRFP